MYILPRLNDTGQLQEGECTTMRRIASVRIYVERAIERVKNYTYIRYYNTFQTQYIRNSVSQIFLCV